MRSSSMKPPRRPWSDRLRRGAIVGAVFVMLGVVTTYLVAWVAVSLAEINTFFRPARPDAIVVIDGEYFVTSVLTESHAELSAQMYVAGDQRVVPQPEWQDELPHALYSARTPGLDMRFVRMAGWPFRCVWGAHDAALPPVFAKQYVYCSGTVWGAHRTGRVQLSSPRGIDGRLPLGVIWSRFVPNVLIHAAMLFALWHGCAFVSRWTRTRWNAKCNRCPSCGYDRRGLAIDAVCPECGGAAGTFARESVV